MNGTALLFLLPYLSSLAISAGIAGYCWRHRDRPGARPYAWLALGQATWTFGYLCEMVSTGPGRSDPPADGVDRDGSR